jgi:hypothetical protein
MPAAPLRKAGCQLKRKLDAVLRVIASDLEFCTARDLNGLPLPQHQHGWIVDTGIECDHQRFSEVLIALCDDRHLLNDLRACCPEGTAQTSPLRTLLIQVNGRCVQRASASSSSLT